LLIRRGREKLFEPSARLDPSAAPGSGLGLATVRGILARHGGDASATDAPAGGARVTLRFPRPEGA
jgi:signal transduction histidine kinase